MTDTNEVVDFSAFEADVDRVVEAAANRSVALDDIDQRYYAFLRKLGERKAELNEELVRINDRETYAARVRNQQIAAARAAFVEATEGLNDEPPF